MNEGYICIHRQLKNHWLWKSERHLKWWLDILLTVNSKDSIMEIYGKSIECKRGQSIRSLDTWAKDWNVSKGAVRNFFKLLSTYTMSYTESLGFTTRLTVCNYDNYQRPLHERKIRTTRPAYPNNILDKSNINTPWKSSYDIYKKECSDAFKILSQDEDLKNKIKVLYPDLDFDKSLAKSYLSHWGTEEGWEGKKKTGRNKINWRTTVLKTIQFNAVKL